MTETLIIIGFMVQIVVSLALMVAFASYLRVAPRDPNGLDEPVRKPRKTAPRKKPAGARKPLRRRRRTALPPLDDEPAEVIARVARNVFGRGR